MTWTQTADGYTHLISLELDSDLQVNGNATITGTLTTTGAISDGADLVLANGKALKTDSTTAHTALIQAYDVDGVGYKTFVTLTNGNTPSMAIAAPSGGTVAIDGATIGATTPAAASVTAMTATSTSNQLILGTTRTLTLTAPTPASSSRTVTLPDPGGSDSVAYLALSQALTNKTINGNTITSGTGTLTLQGSAVVTGPATTGTVALINPPPQAGGTTIAVSAIMSGKPILLDTAGGTTATLPAATGSGNRYKFIVTVSTTSAAHKILAASSSDFIIGNAYGYTGSTAKVFGSPAATNHSIQMPNSGSQPSGGIIGDVFDFVDVGTNLWHCIGFYQAGTTPTTPFSSSTS